MAEYKLALKKRELTGKKVRSLREKGLIPLVVYGGKEPALFSSEYVATEKTLSAAGYHSPIDLDMDGKKQLAIVKNIHIDPVSRRIINIEFQAVSANEVVEATAPIVIANFEASEAAKTYHFALTQTLEGIEVKAKPANLPKELVIDASNLKEIDDKLTIADIVLPKNVELADRELDAEQVVASLYDPAVEVEKREAEEEGSSVESGETSGDDAVKPEAEAEAE